MAGIFVWTTLPSIYSFSGQTPDLTARLPTYEVSLGSKPHPVGHGAKEMMKRGPVMRAAFSILRARSSGSAPMTVATYAGLCAAQMANRSFLKPG